MVTVALSRILLVEDDPDIREASVLLLSEVASFHVRACASATEALQCAPAFGPDLILLDVMMPGLHGEEAFTAFRQMPETEATPVIFLTAKVQPGEIIQYRKLGALGVIPKPYDPDTLAETIQGMWDRHQTAQIAAERREVLAAPRLLYAEDLPERLRAIETAAARLHEEGWDPQVATSLYEMAHRLAGSAALYGFPAVSAAAHRIGRFASQHASDPVDPRYLLDLVEALVHSLEQPVARGAIRVPRLPSDTV
jgi:CheY-like chemotaxis protein